MNIRLLCTVFAFSALGLGTSLAAKPPSRLSTFKGDYVGTALVTGAITATGPAFASFDSSATKNSGVLKIGSILTDGTDSFGAVHWLTFAAPNLGYKYALTSAGFVGGGSVSVAKKKVTYSAIASYSGTTYSIAGTIVQKSPKKLLITETISSGGTLLLTTQYVLNRKKP